MVLLTPYCRQKPRTVAFGFHTPGNSYGMVADLGAVIRGTIPYGTTTEVLCIVCMACRHAEITVYSSPRRGAELLSTVLTIREGQESMLMRKDMVGTTRSEINRVVRQLYYGTVHYVIYDIP